MLTVITSISLDHTEILGDTIEKIAAEKAGIIKKGVPVFFDGSSPEASEVIRRTALAQGSWCREISKNAYEIREVARKYIAFSRDNTYDKDVIYRIPICETCQAMNAEIALEAVEYLLDGQRDTLWDKQSGHREEMNLPERQERWAKALAGVYWPGRMEEAAPHLFIDGAHNPGAIEVFVDSVRRLKSGKTGGDVLVFSAVSDKKYEKMIAYLCRHLEVRAIIVTKIEDDRGVPAEELLKLFRKYTKTETLCCPRLADALLEARRLQKDGGSAGDIYCLGSLYLAGMVKKLLSGGGLDVEF